VRFNSPLNRLTHQAMQLASWEMFRADINQWRRQQSLIPHPHFGYYRWQQRHTPLTLCGFSPSILPRPSDWPSSHHVTGYWFLDEPPSWQPPADLVRFLESGPPPIYLGFGSMSIENPERLTQVCLEALRISGQRGVLSAGWSGLHHQTPSDDMYPVGSIPHSWLFPRVAVCVHHGGMGTTAAALRAGVPQIIAPVVSDQPYWAERMAQLGVGERCANPTQLTSEVLATAITRAVTDPERRQRAVDLGAQVSAEDGVGQAVQLINQVLL
jgi:UDP:flavonoid glycosyltransferase YjiC (YdhE family)